MALAGLLFVLQKQPTVKRLDGSKITPAEIDGTVTHLMRAAEVTGVGIAIFNGRKAAYLKTYGVRDKEKNLPLTEDSVMTAASFSKVTFGYMVMQLVDQGILDLDKPVYQYLPKPLAEYPDYKDLSDDPRYQRISARMLLSHTSGFPNWRAFEEDHKLHIHFEPGSRYAYSGEGIVLLQLAVETVTKKPLEELMREHVFQPFGMTRSGMVWQSRFESDYANGYDERGRSLGPERRQKADAAGSMQTTLGDFTRFLQAVMQGSGMRKETRELMLSPQIRISSRHQFPTFENETTEENKAIRLSYGLGWGLYWTPYGKAFFKEGHDEGWRNYTVCFDKQKTGILIMTNSSNGEGIFKELLETLLKNTFTPIEWERYTPYNQLPPREPLKGREEAPSARGAEKSTWPAGAGAAMQSGVLYRRWISAPPSGGTSRLSRATRARRVSNPQADFPACRRAQGKYSRHAGQSPPAWEGSWQFAAFSPPARNFPSSWA
jgi:CubicO group peptidase (beta-lactamase class C family)